MIFEAQERDFFFNRMCSFRSIFWKLSKMILQEYFSNTMWFWHKKVSRNVACSCSALVLWNKNDDYDYKQANNTSFRTLCLCATRCQDQRETRTLEEISVELISIPFIRGPPPPPLLFTTGNFFSSSSVVLRWRDAAKLKYSPWRTKFIMGSPLLCSSPQLDTHRSVIYRVAMI